MVCIQDFQASPSRKVKVGRFLLDALELRIPAEEFVRMARFNETAMALYPLSVPEKLYCRDLTVLLPRSRPMREFLLVKAPDP